jgi:hypothetical protein
LFRTYRQCVWRVGIGIAFPRNLSSPRYSSVDEFFELFGEEVVGSGIVVEHPWLGGGESLLVLVLRES